jgi:hypothetical protein
MDRREKPAKDLTRNEQHLLEQLRGMKFGSMTVHVKNGQPYRIEERIESIILGTSFPGDNCEIVP